MDKKTLKQYRALLREITLEEKGIERLRKRLEGLPAVMGKVEASMEEFPYVRVHLPVEMPEPKEAEELRKRIRFREMRKAYAEQLAAEIEVYISAIPDSTDRQIFELVYLSGRTYREAGDMLHLDFSTIARRIEKQLSTNSTK